MPFSGNIWGSTCVDDKTWEKQAWAGAGVSFLQTIMSFVPMWCASGASKKAENSDATLQSDLSSVTSDIKDALNELGNGTTLNETTYQSHKAENEPWANNKGYVETDILSNTDHITKQNRQNALKIKKQNGTLESNEVTELANLNEALEKHEKAVKAKEVYDNKIKARNIEIEKQKKAITELLEQKRTFEAEQARRKAAADDAILDKANGNKLSRNTELNIETKFTETGGKYSLTQNQSLEREDIAKLVALYQNAAKSKDTEAQKKYAKILSTIDIATFSKQATKSQLEARRIAKEWLDANN